MRPLAELLSDDPAWPVVGSWISEARIDVVVLPTERARGEDTLLRLQVTSHSVLGAVALETGGILVDHGWLRLLGSGSGQLRGNLASWNEIGDAPEIEPLHCALVVAHDAIGGFFALDGGGLGEGLGHVHHLSPDVLGWESLDLGYSAFVQWTLTADLDGFYGELRWPGWEDELRGASSDLGFTLTPPPFLREGRPAADARRALVPMTELWRLQHDYARQVADLPDGARVRIRVRDPKLD